MAKKLSYAKYHAGHTKSNSAAAGKFGSHRKSMAVSGSKNPVKTTVKRGTRVHK